MIYSTFVLMLYGQPHVMSGDNLVHSVYLQTLSSWTVSLGIDNILYNVAQPLHLLNIEGSVVSLFLCIQPTCLHAFTCEAFFTLSIHPSKNKVCVMRYLFI